MITDNNKYALFILWAVYFVVTGIAATFYAMRTQQDDVYIFSVAMFAFAAGFMNGLYREDSKYGPYKLPNSLELTNIANIGMFVLSIMLFIVSAFTVISPTLLIVISTLSPFIFLLNSAGIVSGYWWFYILALITSMTTFVVGVLNAVKIL